MAVKIGDAAPEFTLPTDNNGMISFKKSAGKAVISRGEGLGTFTETDKNIVLYFYPKDGTSGCTIEAKEFRDLTAEFNQNNTVIIGVSKDSVKSHDTFKEKLCLPFTLVSDEDLRTCRAYGVSTKEDIAGDKPKIARTTFLINSQGKIVCIWTKVKVEGHAAEVLDMVKRIAYAA